MNTLVPNRLPIFERGFEANVGSARLHSIDVDVRGGGGSGGGFAPESQRNVSVAAVMRRRGCTSLARADRSAASSPA
jgi:hypothetical protein